MPALSPDGKRLAFVYRGDVWVSDSDGGRAYALTQHAELDAYPIFSPDGQWVAFSSLRNSNWDIFVVPATGGEARQMTFSSGAEIATDWSPDGKYLLFTAARDTPDSTLFTLDVASLRFKAVSRDFKSLSQAAFSPDGARIVFSRGGFPWSRPRYSGSGAAQVWAMDTSGGKRAALTEDEMQHLWPRFLPGGREFVAVSVAQSTPSSHALGQATARLASIDSAERTPNLWAYPADPASKAKPRRLTSFVGGSGVIAPAVARQSGDMAFEVGGGLFLLRKGASQPKKLELLCGGEDKANNISREELSTGADEAVPSPDGKLFAFGLGGDLWTVPTEKSKARNADLATRLTDYAGFDRDFVWAKDGKYLYFVSDRANNDRVYALDLATRSAKPVWQGNADARSPMVSPDGKMLAFWVAGPASTDAKGQPTGTGGLYVKAIPTPAPTTAPTPTPAAPGAAAPTPTPARPPGEPSPTSMPPAPTPAAQAPADGAPADGAPAAPAVPAAPAAPKAPAVAAVTAKEDAKSKAEAQAREEAVLSSPAKRVVAMPSLVQGDFSWSPDMKWIAYTRRTTEGEGNSTNVWITPADGTGRAVNVTRLNAWHGLPTWSPDGKYLYFSSDREGAGLYVLPLQPEDARADELEVKFEKPKAPAKVEIDFEDTAQRIRRLSPTMPRSALTVTEQGVLYFEALGDVWSSSYDGKEVKKLTATGGISNLSVSPDGRTLSFLREGKLFTMRPRVADGVAQGGEASPVPFAASMERDVRAQRKAAFTQFWRSYNTRFYDENFHGRDWAEVRSRYEPLLDSVGTRDEFAVLLNRMVGELDTSHAEVSASPNPVKGPSTRYLGVTYDYAYSGPGVRVLDVPKRAPGSYAKTRIKPGEYILAIDGQDVTLDEKLFQVLSDKGDRDFELLVNSRPTKEGARTVKFRALQWKDWGDIYYRNRVERMRRQVEASSNGKLAYVHIAGMGGDNQATFDRELYEYAEGKDGVVIDVRFNGGGNIADRLINWLGTKPYGTYVPRDGERQPAPARGWDKPIVVLMNENSASNAEMFPAGMKATGLAKLVGMPTPGYVIWTVGLDLVDGTKARMPFSGVYRQDGTPMENLGEQPDVRVPMSQDDWLYNRDPQLTRAIELLLQDVAAKKAK